jgi:hypothetical protein
VVKAPGQLRVTTGTPNTTDCQTCDISIASSNFDASIGPDVVLNAGGSVNMSAFQTTTADFTARSGNINLNNIAIIANAFTGVAGRDIVTNNLLWVGQPPNTVGGGPLTLTAGRDIVTGASSQIHVSNGQTATFTANRNLTLYTVETLGALNFTATTGNITLNTDIGGHILNGTTWPAFNPGDLGVASLTMSAPAPTAVITMQGARAQGTVSIATGGTLTATKQITSVFGSVSISAAGGATLSAVPIGSVNQVDYPQPVSPVAPPGPKAPLPGAPGLAGNGAPGLPAFAEISVAPGDQIVGGVIQPGAASGAVGLPGAAGGAGAPGRTGGINGRPGAPTGAAVALASGSSDPGASDPASALRTAADSCGDAGGSQNDTGLDTVDPKKKPTSAAADQKSASCSSSASGGQAVPGTTTGADPAPGGKSDQAAPAIRPGGGIQ